MDEKPQNDSQDVQPDQNEQSDDKADVNPEVEELKKTLEEKEEQIANLSKTKRELKKEVKEAKKSDEITTKKSDELGYGHLAFLEAKGIKESEIEFVEGELEKSGDDLKALIGNEYFQAKLKTHRDVAAVKDATPSNTRAGGESPSTKAEFWINKGEMPEDKPENAQLRREVVNKKMAISKNANQFSSNPIVSQ